MIPANVDVRIESVDKKDWLFVHLSQTDRLPVCFKQCLGFLDSNDVPVEIENPPISCLSSHPIPTVNSIPDLTADRPSVTLQLSWDSVLDLMSKRAGGEQKLPPTVFFFVVTDDGTRCYADALELATRGNLGQRLVEFTTYPELKDRIAEKCLEHREYIDRLSVNGTRFEDSICLHVQRDTVDTLAFFFKKLGCGNMLLFRENLYRNYPIEGSPNGGLINYEQILEEYEKEQQRQTQGITAPGKKSWLMNHLVTLIVSVLAGIILLLVAALLGM